MEFQQLHFVSFAELTNWSAFTLLRKELGFNDAFPFFPIGEFLKPIRRSMNIEDDVQYCRLTVKTKNGGITQRDETLGKNIGTKKQFWVKSGDFVMSKIDARNGAFGVVPDNLDNSIVTNDFPVFKVDNSKILSQFLVLIATTEQFVRFAQSCSSGTTNRQRIDVAEFLKKEIPLPSLNEQEAILAEYNAKMQEAERLKVEIEATKQAFQDVIFNELALNRPKQYEYTFGLQFVNFKDLVTWNFRQISEEEQLKSKKYAVTSIEKNPELAVSIFRGKSPKYQDDTKAIILNQKCNRWNAIELEHAKTVNPKWLASLNKNDFTQEGDILINSTGEGTIGRATTITKEYAGLMYDSHILLLRLNKEKVNPAFFTYLFNSLYGQKQVDSIKSAQSTKQTELGVGNLKRIHFPLPTLEEQILVVDKLKQLEAKQREIENEMKNLPDQAIKDFEAKIFKN